MIKKISYGLVFLSFLICFVANFLTFELHRDIVFFEYLARDLFLYNGEWKYWSIKAAPAFFPDVFFYLVGFKLGIPPNLNILFVVLMQILLLLWAIYLILRKCTNFSKSSVVAVFISITSCFLLVDSRTNMWLWMNGNNDHYASLLGPFWCLYFILCFLSTDKKKWLIALLVGLVVSSTSTIVTHLTFTIPAILFICFELICYKDRIIFRKKLLSILSVIISSVLIAYVLSILIVPHSGLGTRVPLTWDSIAVSWLCFLGALRLVFDLKDLYSLIPSIAFTVIFIFLSIKLFTVGNTIWASDEKTINNSHFLLIFFFFVVPINVTGVILSGGFVDFWGLRYFAFPLALSMVVSLSLFGATISERNIVYSLLVINVLSLVLSSIFVVHSRPESFSQFIKNGVPGYAMPISACLKEIESKGYVLDAGVGDFTYRAIELLSENKRYISIMSNNYPFYFLSTKGVFVDRKKYKWNKINWIILNKTNRPYWFGLDLNYAKQLPSASIKYTCSAADAEIWYYANDELDAFYRPYIEQFLFYSSK